MKDLRKTSIIPAKYGDSKPAIVEIQKEAIPKITQEKQSASSQIPLVQNNQALVKIDNRKKVRPRNKSKAVKIDDELDLSLLDLMEEFNITSDSELIYQLIDTHPLLLERRNKDFFETNPQFKEILHPKNREAFKSILMHKIRKSLERKRASRS